MSFRTRAVAALATLATAAAVSVVVAPEAQAAPLRVRYDAVGSTFIAKPSSTVQLGPTLFKSNLRSSGSFTGSLNIPPTTAAFSIVGLLPATATVNFFPVGRVIGKLTSAGGTANVSAVAKYYVRLSDVKVAGIPANVGDVCQTPDPVSIPVGGPFSITDGGTLTGTYSIGQFSNCGLTTLLINQLVPGDGNTVSLTLSNGRIG